MLRQAPTRRPIYVDLGLMCEIIGSLTYEVAFPSRDKEKQQARWRWPCSVPIGIQILVLHLPATG
jgi:hypothetical protein